MIYQKLLNLFLGVFRQSDGGGMKSCRLRAISYQVTQMLKRATTLE